MTRFLALLSIVWAAPAAAEEPIRVKLEDLLQKVRSDNPAVDIARAELRRSPRTRPVNRPAVMLGDVRNILRRFQTPFDFERRHTGSEQLRQQIERRQVLRAEKIFLLSQIDIVPIAHQIVRQATSLGTLPTIRTAATEGFARQALARVCDAERPVDKHFQRDVGQRTELADFVNR